MSTQEQDQGAESLAIARAYIAALERGETGDALAARFTPDVIQEELPNAMSPRGSQNDLSAILAGAARGQQIMALQRYEIVTALAGGNQVAMEIAWTGTLSVQLGNLEPGHQMRARVAIFLELRDGRIARQRNYDSYL